MLFEDPLFTLYLHKMSRIFKVAAPELHGIMKSEEAQLELWLESLNQNRIQFYACTYYAVYI